jgi:acyl-CoA synthetase (AMP-forming)/AMP-acid ligase II
MQPTTNIPRLATSSPLLAWLDRPGPAGIRFARPDGGWDRWPYARLAGTVRRAAGTLRSAGLRRDDTVVLVAPTGPGFVVGYLATLLAGATPAPTAPPALGEDPAGYRSRLRHILRTAEPRLLVAGDPARQPLAALAGTARLVGTAELLVDGPAGGPDPVQPVELAELALLQFTSGSTGQPRAVRVPFPALEANLAAIGGWLRQGPDDPTASWLPLHHDMGLIGCLLTPLAHQSELWLMPPEQFVRDPVRYLACFGRHGARLTAMPSFGLHHIVRRVAPAQLSGMDFSGWRAVIVGAERISDQALESFWRLLAPYRLARGSLRPAYGLAEATLAVTGLPLAESWTTVEVDAARLVLGEAVAAGGPGRPGSTRIVGCGRPLAGTVLAVRDPAGRELPEDRVGEIEVGGAGLTAGYLPGPGVVPAARFTGHRLRTGDAGFLRDGQLFVVGRLGDSLKLRGRTLFAEDVEAALEQAGLPRRRQAVLLGHAPGPTAVVVVEGIAGPRVRRAGPVLARLVEGARTRLVSVPAGTIVRTTSGKPRRRVLWWRFLTGELAGELIGEQVDRPAELGGGGERRLGRGGDRGRGDRPDHRDLPAGGGTAGADPDRRPAGPDHLDARLRAGRSELRGPG